MSDLQKNFKLWCEKLMKCGVSEEACKNLVDRYGDAIMNGTYSTMSTDGMAYDGALVEISLRRLAVFAVKINSLLDEHVQVPVESIVKVALLSNISKAVRLKKCENEWKIKNMNVLYEYRNGGPAIGNGFHSYTMAADCGVKFTLEESEAMTICDRSSDDLQAKFHCGVLSSIMKCANEMVYAEAQVLKFSK